MLVWHLKNGMNEECIIQINCLFAILYPIEPVA